MKSNPFVLALRAALLVLLGILGHTAFAETDQTSAPIGEFIDPENLENIGKVQSGAEAARDAKRAKDLGGQGKYKDMAQAQFQKYQNSKVGLITLIRKIQKKTHTVISKASERVDKWRTTVPKIRSYTRKTLRYADDSYDFATTFEMSDSPTCGTLTGITPVRWNCGSGRVGVLAFPFGTSWFPASTGKIS
jgi:hypothetical protein